MWANLIEDNGQRNISSKIINGLICDEILLPLKFKFINAHVVQVAQLTRADSRRRANLLDGVFNRELEGLARLFDELNEGAPVAALHDLILDHE